MMRRTIVLIALAAMVVLTAAALGGTGSSTPVAVTLTLSTANVRYGDRVLATGSLEPAVAGEEVVLELVTGGAWSQAGRATTDAAGSFAVEFQATRGGALAAHALSSGALSEPVTLAVAPTVRVKAKPGVAFVGAAVSASIAPSAYSGRVVLTVNAGGETVARTSARAAAGQLRATVPTPGIGRFTVVLSFPESEGFAATFAATRVSARARTLAVGSTGQDVRALTRRLGELRFHVPAISSTFGSALADSVIAFQKAYRLPRTGTVGPATWRMLGRARALRARYRGPSPHIEVDKTRQILLVVREGEVKAVLPVSSGATGNTPEGKHRIRWKALATTTWLGPAILYRTMTFYGNSFAIHGFPSVPAYPASHGCIRIPIWTADWLYDQSPVGETVYVYR